MAIECKKEGSDVGMSYQDEADRQWESAYEQQMEEQEQQILRRRLRELKGKCS